MKKKVLWIGLPLLLLAVLIILRIRCNSAENTKRNLPPPSVSVGIPKRGDLENILYLTGDLTAIQQANIFAKVAGNLERNLVDIGSGVSAGQTLALIDSTIYAQNARQAYAALVQSEANYKNTRLNFERNTSLVAQNLISKQDLDNAKTAYEVAAAQLEAATANFKNAQTQLGYCRVTAPFSGIITKRFFDAGSYVSPTQGNGAYLFTLMDMSMVKIMANIPENDIASLSNIRGVEVTLDALPGRLYSGTVKKISQALDLATRTMSVEIDIPNTDRSLKPGMFANVRIILEKRTNVLTIPAFILQKDDKGSFLFILNQDTTAGKRYVQTGLKQDETLEVLSGILENEKLIIAGQTLVKDKMKVRVVR